MTSAVDSFVEYLAENLPGLRVTYVKATPNNPQSDHLADDSLNVSVLEVSKRGRTHTALISLDLLGSDERTVWGQSERVTDLLNSVQFTPALSYTPDPSAPVPVGGNVDWDADIDFEVVVSQQNYVHLNSTFPIRRVR